MPQDTNAVGVKIVYPSARKPAEKTFALTETVGSVKQFAMEAFGLKDGSDPENGGNQVVYFLHHDREKIDALGRTLAEFRNGEQQEMLFRLVREVIVG
jgi:hypothetical protein